VAKYVTAILVGFLIWELIALVLGNQPNVVFVRRLVVGERGRRQPVAHEVPLQSGVRCERLRSGSIVPSGFNRNC
jgi:hypothetical protein